MQRSQQEEKSQKCVMLGFISVCFIEETLKDDLKSLHHPINDGRHVSQGQAGH